MIVEPLIGTMRGISVRTRLLTGALPTALVISLSMVWIARLLNVDIGVALPSAFGAMGAALYVARTRNGMRRRFQRRRPGRRP